MRKVPKILISFICVSILIFAFTTYTVSAENGYDDTTAGNPIITSIFTADPSAHVWPSDPTRLFLYPSQDMFPAIGCDLMDRYHVFSTDNMADWVNHGEILRRADLDTNVWGHMYPNSYFMWAPDAAYSLNHPDGHGPYFFFFPVNIGQAGGSWTNNWKIGIAHSNRPEGGFRDNEIVMLRDMHGQPIHGTGVYIDPSIFWNPDSTAGGNNGNHYLVVGGSAVMRVARLEPCLSQLAEEWHVFNRGNAPGQIPFFHEGPWMFSRVNDYGVKIYYVMYAADNEAWPGSRPDEVSPHGGALAYVSSIYGPHGPWTFGSAILQPSVTTDTSHGSIVEFLGEWYLFYHTDVLSMGQNNLRSTSVDKITFNPDGSMQPVVRTETSVPPVGPPTCPDYLNNRFGAGNWTIEVPFRYLNQGNEDDFDGFVLNHVYDVMLDSVIAGGGAIKNPSSQIIQNLHIAGSYIEFTNVDGGSGGQALLQLTYGRDGTGGLARITVNGEHVHAMRVAPSNGWYNFSGAAFLVVELEPGTNNTIRVDSFAFNVRSLSVHHKIVDIVGPPQQQVASAIAGLTWNRIRLDNILQNDVTTDLHLPIRLVEEGQYDVTVTWASTNPDVISTAGAVTRPRDANASVTLTATVSKDAYSQTVTFDLTVVYDPVDTGGSDLLQLIPGPNIGDAWHNVPGAPNMVWEYGNNVVGWIRPWAWIRFDDVDLQAGIESFMVRYARAAGPTSAHFQLWAAPPGSPVVPGANDVMNLPTNAVMIGEIHWDTTNTGGWGMPGNIVYTDIIAYSGEGRMDLYAVFVQGEFNFAYVAIEVAEWPTPVPHTLNISPATASVQQGETQLFTATVYDTHGDELADAIVVWSIADNNGYLIDATIDSTGLLTIGAYVPAGTMILIMAVYAGNDTIYDMATVTVTASAQVPCCDEYPYCICNETPYEPQVDRSALQALIAQALLLNPNVYTASSWDNLLTAKIAAQAALAYPYATQIYVDTALAHLQAAIHALVFAGTNLPPDPPVLPPQLPPQQPVPPQPPVTYYVPVSTPLLPLVQRQQQPQPSQPVDTDDDAYILYDDYDDCDDYDEHDSEDDSDTEYPVETVEHVLVPPPPPTAAVNRLTFTAGNVQYMFNGQSRMGAGIPFIDPATDRMMIPLRTLAEALGVEVDWDSATRSALVHLPTGTIAISADELLPDGMGSAIMVNDRVFIPLRFVMYAFNATVEWDSIHRAGIITW